MRRSVPSQTAEIVALMRAMEERRPPGQRILHDPHARHFLGPGTRTALAAFERSGRIGDILLRHVPGLATFVAARHRYMDDCLVEAITRKRDRAQQLLVLGAGYDMRGHRLVPAGSGVRVFELDHPATAKRKGRILDRLTARGALDGTAATRLTIDFHREALGEVLDEGGFQRDVRTFVTWEGVAMYLTRQAVKDTLASLHELLAPRSEIVLDLWYLTDQPDLRSAAHRLSTSLLHLLGEPVLFSMHPEDVGAFLGSLGFELREVADVATLKARYVKDARPIYPTCYVAHARRR